MTEVVHGTRANDCVVVLEQTADSIGTRKSLDGNIDDDAAEISSEDDSADENEDDESDIDGEEEEDVDLSSDAEEDVEEDVE